MSGRFSARTLHRVAASHRHNEAVMAWSGRDAVLPNRDPAILIKKRDALQSQFADLAQAVSTFGADAASVAKLEQIRGDLALLERDLVLAQSDSAA